MDSINEIWMAVLNYMKPQVSETAYRMWLQDLILKTWMASVLWWNVITK